MGEISEMERARRALKRSQRKTNETAAQSFRLGKEHLEKLKKMAQRSGNAQVDILRDLIDSRWREIEKKRKRKS